MTAVEDISNTSGVVYTLGGEGQGIGEVLDCIQFINLEQKDDSGPIKYGMVVGIKAPAAKEKLLGIREGTKLGFFRNLVGQGEKWCILKGVTSNYPLGIGSPPSSSIALGRGASCEEAGSRGTFVLLGDMVMLQTFKSDHYLCLNSPALYAYAGRLFHLFV